MHAPEATAVWVCLFDDDGAETRAPADRAVAGHLARRAARTSPPAPATATGPTAPGSPSRGCGSTPHKLLLDPYARAVCGEVTADPAIFGYDLDDARRARRRPTPRRTSPRSVVVGTTTSTGATTSRCSTAGATPSIYELHVKGMTAAARPGPRGAARDVRRAGHAGGHRLPARPRRHRGRAAAGPPVRLRAGAGGARAGQLLGLQLDRLLRPARRLLRLRRPRPAGHRVQADGEGVPRRRHRGDPRRRLQPHRRGRAARADAVASAGSTTAASTAGSPRPAERRRRRSRRHLLGRHRLRQHRRRRATRSRCG